MQSFKNHTCKYCGNDAVIVFGGKYGMERLCADCLAIAYPELDAVARGLERFDESSRTETQTEEISIIDALEERPVKAVG
jgi:hypothetical protein